MTATAAQERCKARVRIGKSNLRCGEPRHHQGKRHRARFGTRLESVPVVWGEDLNYEE